MPVLKLVLTTIFQYSLCLLVFFLLEMAIAIMGFIFPHTMQSVVEESFTVKIIHKYPKNDELSNFIAFAQTEVRMFFYFKPFL